MGSEGSAGSAVTAVVVAGAAVVGETGAVVVTAGTGAGVVGLAFPEHAVVTIKRTPRQSRAMVWWPIAPS